MEKIKIDKYTIREKGRTYEVLKFPFIRYMWAFDCHPEENMLMVDGCQKAFKWMKYAFAILANDDSKIIYFPCKQSGIGHYYSMPTYHLVLCRPELQLRRSRWFQIKKKLDKKHVSGKYVLSYNRKKLVDYYESGLGGKYPVKSGWRAGQVYIPCYLTESKQKVEEILGDTIFFIMPRLNWLEYHYQTIKDLDSCTAGDGAPLWSAIGWIMRDRNIREMQKEAEEEKKDQKRKREEESCFL